MTGVQGATGAQGVSGFQGETGVQGGTGAQGVTGVQGLTGAQGVTGVQGLTGAQGEAGFQGDTGFQGVTGVQGAQGEAGFQGATGFQGVTGVQGVTGAQGDTGIQGPQGPGWPTLPVAYGNATLIGCLGAANVSCIAESTCPVNNVAISCDCKVTDLSGALGISSAVALEEVGFTPTGSTPFTGCKCIGAQTDSQLVTPNATISAQAICMPGP